MSRLSRNPEAEACAKQRPAHIGKSEQQERPSAVSIDRPDCWECENKIDKPKSKGRQKCVDIICAGEREDGRGIKRDDIDW